MGKPQSSNPVKSNRNPQSKKFRLFLLTSALVAGFVVVAWAFLGAAENAAGVQASQNGAHPQQAATAAPGQTVTATVTTTVTATATATATAPPAATATMSMTHNHTMAGHTPAATSAEPALSATVAVTATAKVTATMVMTQTHNHTMTGAEATTVPQSPVSGDETLTQTAEMQDALETMIGVMQGTVVPSATVEVATPSPTPTATPTAIPTATPTSVPAAASAAPGTATASGALPPSDVRALMDEVLLLVRSHLARMAVILANNPTPEEIAQMNAEMEVLTRIMQLLIKMQSEGAAGSLSPVATPMPGMTMPGTELTPTVVLTDTMGTTGDMDMSSMGGTPMAPMAPTGVPTATMGSMNPSADQASLSDRIRALAGEMQAAQQEMQAMMARGATPEEVAQMRARLEELQFRMRDLMAELQGAVGPAPATLADPAAAAAASAAAAGGGMGDMMANMSGMMDGMMGGMGSASGSMAGMSTPDATGAAAGGMSTDPSLVRIHDAGAVKVTVTPLNLGAAGATALDFHVKIETHSVSFDQDLSAVSVLRTPAGVEVAGNGWDGPTSGHHVEGTLSFPTTDGSGASIMPLGSGMLMLSIRDFAGVPERAFSWDLGQ